MSENAERYCEIRDEETLRAVVAHWQRVLRLQDWGVECHLVAEHALGENQVAACWADVLRREAQVLILRPETRLERWKAHDGTLFYGRQPMEVDVVHELIHIWTKQCGLNSLEKESKECVAMEQMAESFATAFVRLHSYFAPSVGESTGAAHSCVADLSGREPEAE